jgi:predicted nucleic acid-binding protein
MSAFVDTNVIVRHLTADPPEMAARATAFRRSIEVYEVHRLDFAEAYLIACAETTGVGSVVSFDQSIDRVPTVQRVEP